MGLWGSLHVLRVPMGSEGPCGFWGGVPMGSEGSYGVLGVPMGSVGPYGV